MSKKAMVICFSIIAIVVTFTVVVSVLTREKTVTLEDISKHVGMSYTYFSKQFAEDFGTNYSHYLNKIRIEKSIDLLTTTDKSITEVALMVGFSSTSHYIKVFKKLMHITPSKYRKL